MRRLGTMRGAVVWLRGQWRLLLLSRNSLARRWDRLEAVCRAAALLLCVAAVPIAILAGTSVYAGEARTAREQLADRYSAAALTLADMPPATDTGAGLTLAQTGQVPGTWRLPDGTIRTGTLTVDPGTPIYSTVPVWLDHKGNLTDAPMTVADATGMASGAGLLVWAVIAALGACLVFAVRAVLDRRRAEDWARAWKDFGRNPTRS